MRRRTLLGSLAAAGMAGGFGQAQRRNPIWEACDCAPQVKRSKDMPPGSTAFRELGSKLRVTAMKVFGVTLPETLGQTDRPYVFVKIETNQGVVGWGEAEVDGDVCAFLRESDGDGLTDSRGSAGD